MHRLGDVVLATIQFVDTFEVKTRPAVVLFEEYGNVVVAGVTSNAAMDGIILTKKDGAMKNSVIKLNYIFTVSEKMVKKHVFSLSQRKKELLVAEIARRLTIA